MENPHGIVYADGTVFLYSFTRKSASRLAFTAVVLLPGDVTWTLVKTMLDCLPCIGRYFSATAAYHDGQILVCADLDYWCILTPDENGASRDLELSSTWYGERRYRGGSYVLEFQGQLLWVSVLVCIGEIDPVCAVSLVVHAWEEDKMRWVARNGQSLGGHVLFLRPRPSFAVDAAQLSVGAPTSYSGKA
jgi:hypothetical protein